VEDNPVTVIREATRRLSLPPLLESGVALRQAIGAALEKLGASREENADMVLAVNEAFNNAICHGSIGRSDHVDITIEVLGRELLVALDYRGEPFAVTPPALPEVTNPHGRGRYLMERLADQVNYSFHDGWTHTELRKSVGSKRPARN
jgi:anti-sigma regulatory factor (Ser/Thr protein kinase)